MQKTKFYIFSLFVLLAVFGIGLIWILQDQTPESLGSIILFYADILVFSFSLFSLAGLYGRRIWGSREMLGQYLSAASRQGGSLAILLTISLFLLHNHWFNWLNALLLVLTLVCWEAYQAVKKNNSTF